jgi:DNA-binding CsgD family transcriptional regulator
LGVVHGDVRVVGREAERLALERFVEELADGSTRLLLEGEPGIGKTELWKEGTRAALARSYCVLSCRLDDVEVNLGYAALGDLLEPVLDEILLALQPVRRQALETALLRGVGGEAADRRAVSVAVVDGLRELTRRAPVLLGLDDLQWLDRSTAQVLRFALRRLEHEPLGLLATARSGEGDALMGSLGLTNVERLQLGPLKAEQLDEVLRSRLGASFLRSTLEQLHAVSGGNPFFGIELARALLRRPVAPSFDQPLPVPRTLRELVAERLAGLPDDVRSPLLLVAAMSQPTVGLLEKAVGSRDQALEFLAGAVEAGVLEVERGRLRFGHPLLRAAVYADAPRGARRGVHRLLAGIVRDSEERARHLALATEVPDVEVAAALEEAGRRAGARGAPDAAAAFVEQALRLTPSEHADDALRRAVVASDFLWESGEMERARRSLDELSVTLPPGEDRARVLRRLARVDALVQGFQPVVPLLERARIEAGGNKALRATIERDLALTLVHCGNLRRARSHARDAVRLAGAAGDRALIVDVGAVLDGVGFLLGGGPPQDLRERASEPRAADETPLEPQPSFLQHALTWAAMLKWTDDFDAAREALGRLRLHVRERHEEARLFPVLFHLAELECWAGNLSAARTWATEVEQVTLRISQPGVQAQSLYIAALVAALLGRVEEARAHACEGLALAEQAADLRVAIRNLKTLGFLDLSLGEPASACVHLARALELSARAGFGDPGFFRLDADAIEALLATGQLDRAQDALTVLESRGERLRRPWALATAGRCRALLASARGEPTAALQAVERALREHARLSEPLELGRTLLVKGTLHRRAKQKRLARTSLEGALEIFEQVGAPLWVKRARAELARISGRAPAPDGLTPTERRVAELVSAGRTNKEVAAELLLTVKAVEANLSRIYRKLSVRSRTELAARLAKA